MLINVLMCEPLLYLKQMELLLWFIVFFLVVCPVVLYIVLLVKFDPVKVFHHLGRFFTLIWCGPQP